MLLIFGVLILLFASLLGIRVYRMMSDMKQMTPLKTGKITADVFAVKDSYVNMYLLKSSSKYIAFDSGIKGESVQKELQKIMIDPADVSAVFLTHGDTDHTGGLSLFRNAKIYLAKEEEQMVNGKTARFLIFKNKPIPKHELLDDDETVEAEGFKVTAIWTPGHTPGATCYLVDGCLLFTGDTMRLRDGKADIFSKTINMDSETQLQSLRKLARLKGVQEVFTAHFGHTNSFDSAFQAFTE